MSERGFTLIEVLVALAIAATALVVLAGRMGASADIQAGVSMHALMRDTAVDLLERQRLEPEVSGRESDGEIEVAGRRMTWRIRVEKTPLSGFVRQNVEVRTPGEPPLRLFLYRRR